MRADSPSTASCSNRPLMVELPSFGMSLCLSPPQPAQTSATSKHAGAWTWILDTVRSPNGPAGNLPDRDPPGADETSLRQDALELDTMPHRMDDRVLEHLLERVRLTPAAEVLLRREVLVLERSQMPAPAVERLLHERVESRNDHFRVADQRQTFDRSLERLPHPQQVAARGRLYVRDESFAALVVGVAVCFRHRLAGGHEPPPRRDEVAQLAFVQLDETAHA